MLLCSFATFSKEETLTPEAYLASISQLNTDPEAYGDYQLYYSTLNLFLWAKLNRIHAPRDLKTVFYRCVKVWHATRLEPKPQEQLTWLDPHFETLESVMYRLSEIGSDEAARVMVELYCDDSVGWDAGFSLEGADAIVKCGKAALPHLEQRNDPERLARLIALIRAGEKTAF